MQICRNLNELRAQDESLHLALGVFDGVHIGHQAVIARAMEAAKRDGGLAGLLTFDPHPIEVMAPAKAPRALLATLDHKVKFVESLGVDLVVPLHFDLEMAEMEADDFIAKLMEAPVKTVAVGEDWRFGHARKGDVDLLRKLSSKYGFQLEAVAPVMFDGDRISSTRIRQTIHDGNLCEASKMLGRCYSMCGEVVKGRQLGGDLGFPTANLVVGRRQCPPHGVWTVKAHIEGNGEWHPGVANLGTRPTVHGEDLLLEVHLLDFVGDLYGKEIEVRFELHLRSEIQFDSLGELKAQIEADVEEARECLEDD
ncbi:MAG: bifunctional riboflavin kinase/FAD synthetase [Akkermansiaceae bacterium]|nr:bifunctional riboflavin kinase/FAD synthetase [Akkermansiaceae bacterium]